MIKRISCIIGLAALLAALPALSEAAEEVIELTEEIEYIEDDDAIAAMPEIIEFVEAQYPEELVKSGISGGVLLQLMVDEKGAVDSVTVVRPLHPKLDASALEAVRKFKFSPAKLKDGEAVAVMLQYEYRFSFKEEIVEVAAPVPEVIEAYINLSGKFLERGTRNPVVDALVILEFADTGNAALSMPFSAYLERIGKFDGQELEDSRLVATTDSLGEFRFFTLPACSVTIRVQSPDYETFTTGVRVSRTEEVKVTGYIMRADYMDYELVVYGKAEEVEVSRRQLTIAEVRRIPGLGGEAVRVVQAMPGVARPSFGGNTVVVRGLPNWASNYYIDGLRVPLLYHLGGQTSSYPSEAVEAVDFYPGGFSSRYGGTTGGVIEMRSRKSKGDKLHGYVDLSNLDGALFLEGPVTSDVSFMASGRRGFIGDILAFYFKQADPKNTTVSAAPFYWDYLLRTDVKVKKDHELFVTLMGSRDSLGVFIPIAQGGSKEIDDALDELNIKIMFHTLMMGLNSRIDDRWTNALRFSGAYMSTRMSALGMVKMEETPTMGHLRNQVSYKASDNLTVHAGADINLIRENLKLTMNTGLNMIYSDTISGGYYGNVGGYTNIEWRPIDKLLLFPGVRYDYYPELDYNGSLVPAYWDYGIIDNRRGGSGEPSFRISSRYEVVDGHTAKAAVGNYSQSPEPMGMVIHETYGEPDLPATKAAHYVLGYEWQATDLLNLDVQGYYNTMWDVARSYNGRLDYDPTREVQRKFFSDGSSRTYGLELMLRHNRSERFFGWISYTLSRSEAWSKEDDKYILSSRDEPHHLQLLGSWRLKNNWEVGTRTRFVSGKPTSPIIGTVENAHSKGISPVYGERNSTRHDPFFQVDVRIDKRYIYKTWMLTQYIDLQNILWPIYKSPEFTYYNYNYTESQKISMIPLIAAGVRAEF